MRLSRMFATSLLFTAIAAAQFPVNPPPERRERGDVRVDPRINKEHYGNYEDYGAFTQRNYFQTGILPSERRFAEQRSGAMPSELRMQRDAVGPLAPNAPMALSLIHI